MLNTAARIGNVAIEEGKAFVISEYIYKKTGEIENVSSASIGQFELRGKLQTVSLYSVTT